MVVQVEAGFWSFDEPRRGEKINATAITLMRSLGRNERVVRSEGEVFSIGEMGQRL